MRMLLLLAFSATTGVSLRLSAPVLQNSYEAQYEAVLSSRVQQPSVYFLADQSKYRRAKRNWFQVEDNKVTEGRVDLYKWTLTNENHNKNLQFVHNDFERTTMLDQWPSKVRDELIENKISVVLCWGTWAGRSVPPVYVESQKGGEARALTSWIGALLSLGQNVLVADSFEAVGVNTCGSDLIKQVNKDGKILFGVDPGTAETMELLKDRYGKWPDNKVLKPCSFMISYFDVPHMPKISAMPHTHNLMKGTVDMTHMGFATQCWSAEPVDRFNQAYTNSLMFYMKGKLEQFPVYMQQDDFWADLQALVKSHDENIKITALAPSRYTTPRDVMGDKLSAMFEKNGVLTLTHLMDHNQLMGLLKESVLMFGMGITGGSPLPLDALECGCPVILPHGQHAQYLERVPESANLPFHAFGSKEEFLGFVDDTLKQRNQNKGASFTISDFHPQRVLDKMGVFLESMQAGCEAETDGKLMKEQIANAGAEKLTKDTEIYIKLP